ncbi:ESX secretion-associated protein EspG [Lentzea sp. DG1S-22]|uniref:ESX secretion-associated protein EspG n=1 Tax=Lentzea sp. DG1S-22 TaxID=3108822 RepID=UPI002E76A5D1|nr:ESX secretion-associated protein EspG [Lentzea sp. DG1S-22]WVH77509.1 ESX secretion-associated protein EspG [Lentzea sp. DG1S-22]
MLRSSVQLSDLAFDVLWKQEKLGAYHPALSVGSPGENEDERVLIERDVIGELRRVGLDHPDVRGTLHLIAKADNDYSAWIALTPNETRPVVVAANAQHGVLAVHDNGYVQLHPIRPENAPEVLAMQLPDVPPGKGASINVHASELNVHQPGKASPSTSLRQLLAQPRRGTAKLYAAKGSPEGRQRARTFLTTIDFEDGRWLVVRYTDQNHQTWVHATPASRQIITDWLKRLT